MASKKKVVVIYHVLEKKVLAFTYVLKASGSKCRSKPKLQFFDKELWFLCDKVMMIIIEIIIIIMIIIDLPREKEMRRAKTTLETMTSTPS